jgi:hypothetical protein
LHKPQDITVARRQVNCARNDGEDLPRASWRVQQLLGSTPDAVDLMDLTGFWKPVRVIELNGIHCGWHGLIVAPILPIVKGTPLETDGYQAKKPASRA